MLNLTRTGSALALGAGSGAIEPPTLAPLMLGTTALSWSTVLEAVGLIAGAGLQFVSPYTMPNVADGLVDGSVALLARRGANYAIARTRTAAPFAYGQQAFPNYNGAAMAGAMGARGAIGSVGGVPKRTLT